MAASYVTQAATPAQDMYYGPFSDDDSDDDEIPPLKELRMISDKMRNDETLSRDFIKAWTQIRKRNHTGSWQPASLTMTNGRRIADTTE